MIELYASVSPNVQKVEIFLEEAGLEYAVRVVDLYRGEQYSPEFTSLTPIQKVPVIVDRDGPGGQPITVIESGAILIYLAEKTGKFLPTEPRARAEVMQWLMVQLTTVGPMLGQFNHFIAQGQHDQYGVERFTSQARRLYDQLEARLARSPYLGGQDYGIADIATFPWIRVEERLHTRNHPVTRTDWDGHPNLNRWFASIAERPAVIRAMVEADHRPTTKSIATAAQLDRFYGRGEFALPLA